MLTIENKTEIAHAYTDLVRDTGASYGTGEIDAARRIIDAVDDTVGSTDTARQLLAARLRMPGWSHPPA